MSFFSDLFSNRIFLSAAAGWFVAQVLKTLIYGALNKELSLERMVGAGGMPSSHSATVCALATSVCLQCGAGSPEFAIALFFAFIVMYDARGVRRETGIQAKVLNEMIDIFTRLGEGLDIDDKLKEFVGHTPLQVSAGAILGFLIALLLYNFY